MEGLWEQGLQAAKDSSNSTNVTDHPLSGLVQRFTYDQVRKVGGELYSVLSTNIHHYPGAHMVVRDQWDELPGAILEALMPKCFVGGSGSVEVDWTGERLGLRCKTPRLCMDSQHLLEEFSTGCLLLLPLDNLKEAHTTCTQARRSLSTKGNTWNLLFDCLAQLWTAEVSAGPKRFTCTT